MMKKYNEKKKESLWSHLLWISLLRWRGLGLVLEVDKDQMCSACLVWVAALGVTYLVQSRESRPRIVLTWDEKKGNKRSLMADLRTSVLWKWRRCPAWSHAYSKWPPGAAGTDSRQRSHSSCSLCIQGTALSEPSLCWFNELMCDWWVEGGKIFAVSKLVGFCFFSSSLVLRL